MPSPLDSVVEQFVKDHLFIVGSSALTVFLAGIAVGKFLFDRLVAILRAEAENLKNQRDEAREQLRQAQLQVRQQNNGEKEREIEAEKEVSRARALSSFVSPHATILITPLLAPNAY